MSQKDKAWLAFQDALSRLAAFLYIPLVVLVIRLMGYRFRELKASEMKAVAAGDDLMASNVCGPRIMWPNALVLETLLLLGYEKHERVQAALSTILRGGWCECGYQHGTGDWRGRPQPTMAEVAEWEKTCLREYTYGGIPDVDLLRKMDLTRKVGIKMPRVARTPQAKWG